MGEVIDFFSRKVIKEDTNHAAGNKKIKQEKKILKNLKHVTKQIKTEFAKNVSKQIKML